MVNYEYLDDCIIYVEPSPGLKFPPRSNQLWGARFGVAAGFHIYNPSHVIIRIIFFQAGFRHREECVEEIACVLAAV